MPGQTAPFFQEKNIESNLSGFFDPTGQMTLEAAKTAKFVPFDSIKYPLGFLKNNDWRVWFRLDLNKTGVQKSAETGPVFFFFGEKIAGATAFFEKNNEKTRVLENGKSRDGERLPSFFLVEFPNDSGPAPTVFFRLKSQPFKSEPIVARVVSEKNWLSAKSKNYQNQRFSGNLLLVLGAILAFMVFFSITQFTIHREVVFLFYAGYLLAALSNIYRFNLEFLLPSTILTRFTSAHGNALATFLGHFFYFWFVIQFLGLRKTLPRFYLFLKWAGWVALTFLGVYFLLFFGFARHDWARGFYYFSRFFFFFIVVFSFLVVIRRRFPFYGFILAGGLPMLFGATWWLVFGLRSRLGLSGFQHPNLVFYACAVAESLVFMSGLGYKFRVTELAKRRAQEKLLSERARISRDLHDDVGSTLNSLALLSEVSKRQSDNIPQKTLDSLDEIKKIARDCIHRVGDIAWSVSPKADSLSDLTGRMREFAFQLFQGENVRLRFHLPQKLDSMPLPADLRWNLYLIFKEAVNNTRKYASATLVEVTISEQSGQLQMVVSDNGHGFDPEKIRPGSGLVSMRERAQSLGGQFSMTSGLDSGTQVSVVFPLKNHIKM